MLAGIGVRRVAQPPCCVSELWGYSRAACTADAANTSCNWPVTCRVDFNAVCERDVHIQLGQLYAVPAELNHQAHLMPAAALPLLPCCCCCLPIAAAAASMRSSGLHQQAQLVPAASRGEPVISDAMPGSLIPVVAAAIGRCNK
jgi:hypothetical protein